MRVFIDALVCFRGLSWRPETHRLCLRGFPSGLIFMRNNYVGNLPLLCLALSLIPLSLSLHGMIT
jgi:hypothetical protein